MKRDGDEMHMGMRIFLYIQGIKLRILSELYRVIRNICYVYFNVRLAPEFILRVEVTNCTCDGHAASLLAETAVQLEI